MTTTKSMLSFSAYATKLAQGGTGIAATCARITLHVRRDKPSGRRGELHRLLQIGRITHEEYHLRMDAVADTESRWLRSMETHTDPCALEGGWQQLGEGTHMRATYLPGGVR